MIGNVVDLQSRPEDELEDAQLHARTTDVQGWFTFSQFLSATIGPPVALVSAPKQIPSSSPESPPPNFTPTMVVPVDVAVEDQSGCSKLSACWNVDLLQRCLIAKR
jgi:hypothetical protein